MAGFGASRYVIPCCGSNYILVVNYFATSDPGFRNELYVSGIRSDARTTISVARFGTQDDRDPIRSRKRFSPLRKFVRPTIGG